jgi:hypothetical protein
LLTSPGPWSSQGSARGRLPRRRARWRWGYLGRIETDPYDEALRATDWWGRSPLYGVIGAALALVVLVLAGCSADVGETQATESAVRAPTERSLTGVSFASDVQPVVEEVCARCHTGDGPGAVHVAMDTAGEIAANAFDIGTVVSVGEMPPWPASDLGPAYERDWSLDEDQIDAIVRWSAVDGPLDVDPAMAIVPVHGPIALEDFDAELRPAKGYDGTAFQPDEYRCYVYDPGLSAEAFVEAYEFVPDQTEVVHHAIGYLIPGSRMDRANELSAQDSQDGWSCFGGSGLGVNDIFLGWAPGQTATEFEVGSGLHMGAGDFMVLQVHYHFEVDAPPDQSALRLRWVDDATDVEEIVVGQYFAPAEIPCSEQEEGPLCDREAAMARALDRYGAQGVQADFILALCGQDPNVVGRLSEQGVASGSCDQPVNNPGHLVSVLGHAHELGRSFRMTLNPGRPDERILLDIPNWSFDWQFAYEPVEDIELRVGDTVRVECTWDRTLRDPVLEPAYVFWADGTDDEMCFATLVTSGGDRSRDAGAPVDLLGLFDASTRACVQGGVRAEPDGEGLATVLLSCLDPSVVADTTVDTIGAFFGVGLTGDLRECLSAAYARPGPLGDLIDAYLSPLDDDLVAAAAALFGDCAKLGSVIAGALPQLELSAETVACLDDNGRGDVEDIFTRSLRGLAPRLPTVVLSCLSPDEIGNLSGG